MKTLPRTRIIIVTAISSICFAAVLVFAKPLTPTPTTKDNFKLHLQLREAQCVKGEYDKALSDWKSKPGHNDHDHHIHYDNGAWDGDYSRKASKPNSNVTQHLATQNAQDLIDFLTTAGIK